MGKLGKSITRLIFLGIFGSWFVFTIWGISYWNDPTSFVPHVTTIALMYVPLFIGMFILFIIGVVIGAIPKGKKKKKEEKEAEKKISKEFKDLKDIKDFKELKEFIPDEWKEKFKKFVESQEK